MKRNRLILWGLPLLLIIALVHLSDLSPVESATTQSQKRVAFTIPETPVVQPGFAVVELFTSEGCSSCPPADDLLGAIVKQATEEKSNIYSLAFHVDYWNRLGWKDPFSDAAYSARQRTYAGKLAARGVYTPQMVVNGSAEFVGSDKGEAEAAIQEALKHRPGVAMSVTTTVDAGAVHVAFTISPAPENAVVNVAIVEQGLSTKVPRGENSGRTLHHENVVRAFRTVPAPADGKGEIEISVPENVDRQKMRIVVYAQETDTWKVLGAAR